jgi:hypothetical protein
MVWLAGPLSAHDLHISAMPLWLLARARLRIDGGVGVIVIDAVRGVIIFGRERNNRRVCAGELGRELEAESGCR